MPPAAETGSLSTVGVLSFAAASGLVAAHDALWVIADDGLQVHRLSRDGKAQARHDLLPGTAPLPIAPKARKKAKPDFEALCLLPDGRLLVLGSGSRANRRRGCLVDTAKAAAAPIDASGLYEALEAEIAELNIEGGCVIGTTLMLAHRGNSAGAADALVLLDLATVLADLPAGTLAAHARRRVVPVALGALDGVALTLTDLAADPQGRLCFSAAAERTDDRYEDGACAGSVVGRFDGDFATAAQWRLPGRWKIEGLTSDGPDRWLLVADADDPSVLSPLLAFATA